MRGERYRVFAGRKVPHRKWRAHGSGLRTGSGALEKRVGARGERLVVGRVAARAARRPSPSPTRRREWHCQTSGRRATTVRAPLPVGYLPKGCYGDFDLAEPAPND